MAKTADDLIREGYTAKQAAAIVSAREKKKKPVDDTYNIKKNINKRNQALDEIASW